MIRGTTPTIRFKLSIDKELVSEIWLTIQQRGKEVITKTKADMTIMNGIAMTRLTQEETLKLNPKECVKIQARIRTIDGSAFATNILTKTVDDVLKDGVI